MDAGLKKYFKVLEVPPLSFDEAKKLAIQRLDEVRSQGKGSLAPFTEDELRKVYNNSKGNPRLILMLLASLYEEHVKRK